MEQAAVWLAHCRREIAMYEAAPELAREVSRGRAGARARHLATREGRPRAVRGRAR